MDGGLLTIRPRFRPGFKTPEGKTFDFVSGRIDTRDKFDFTYGTAAARMKLAGGAGLWPAFWALGNGRWPDTGEIDVMENVGDPLWTAPNLIITPHTSAASQLTTDLHWSILSENLGRFQRGETLMNLVDKGRGW